MPENWASCYLRLNGATMTDLRDWLKAHNIVTLYKTQNRLTKKLLHFQIEKAVKNTILSLTEAKALGEKITRRLFCTLRRGFHFTAG